MKNAVVFGGSGFIGSHVADNLSKSGYSTTILDQVSSPWLSENQKMVIGDIQCYDDVESIIKGADVVYNFAALADLNRALQEPIKTIKINILGNINILEACRKYSVERFIYASTVYVNSREGGFYRCSKQASEAYLEEYQKAFGLDYTILRYGSLYGPRADNTNGIKRVIKKALETGILSHEGHPDSMREYIHVEDAARASVVALGEEFRNESVVLTGHEPMKVLDVLKMLAEILDLPETAVEFKKQPNIGHYVRTPYSYQTKIGRKYIPPMHVDLAQGFIQVIDEQKREE